ncbi:MAG: 4-alpha-glucanotransferase, partial [Nitrospirota bacterium]
MEKRGSGILLHITSLPSPFGTGDLGLGAYRFVDFLAETGQSFWQILPLNPTCTVYGNSPYSSFSAFAGNPLLISPELLVEDGILLKSDIKDHPPFQSNRVNYKAVTQYKNKILAAAYEKIKENISNNQKFERFCSENS